MSLITCQDVSLAYESNIVVSDLSFQVEKGDYLCIVGENGSGKSTLIKTLLGLKKVSRGKILMGDDLKSTEIGYLPQQTTAQKDFPASVYEVVQSGCLNRLGILPFYKAKEKKIIKENMELLNITQLSKKCYRELSGGQQQRVLLARALCATKRLLLLDEPVAGLDPLVTKELYQIIKELHKNHDITIIMISHDIQSAVHYATHILHLQNKSLFFGKTQDYLQSDCGRQFLGGVSND